MTAHSLPANQGPSPGVSSAPQDIPRLRLIEALEILRQAAAADSQPLRIFLGCGFTPLDLKTFLGAHLSRRSGLRGVEVETGLFGDLAGSLETLDARGFDTVFAIIEWPDIDARLGYRSLGGWSAKHVADIVAGAAQALERLAAAIERLAGAAPVVVSTPTLPLPPLFLEPSSEASTDWWVLSAQVAGFAARLSSHRRVRLLHPLQVDAASPMEARHDVKSDLAAGFPYCRPHAETLGRLLSAAALPQVPRKGLITDLDNTLWRGILGEAGTAGLHWDLEHGAQVHGLYQQTLQALSDSGVLLAVASKNDPAVAEAALGHLDLAVQASLLHPVEANWGPKSESVQRILKAWNIAADSVVFVDDSPMELAEVAAAHPGIETIQFPTNPAAAVVMLRTLRERFAKHGGVTEEDRIRAASLRQVGRAELPTLASGSAEDFLAGAQAVITLDTANPPLDGRALELINKTNQFNLNGRRFTEAEWLALLGQPEAFLIVASYADRFGPLGRIGVMAGRRQGSVALVETWVLSCRAFSRRIEHRMLDHLFAATGADAVELRYLRTERNGPVSDFLASMAMADGRLRITRRLFEQHCPPLYDRLETSTHV